MNELNSLDISHKSIKTQLHEQVSYLEYSYLGTEMPVTVSSKSVLVRGEVSCGGTTASLHLP